jgi:hypothetical protein
MLLLPVLLAIFLSTAKSTRLIAATIVIPIPYLIALLGPPLAALPAVLFLAFLVALARESYIDRHPAKALPRPLAVGA